MTLSVSALRPLYEAAVEARDTLEALRIAYRNWPAGCDGTMSKLDAAIRKAEGGERDAPIGDGVQGDMRGSA
jgi:hypothetical protein